MRPFLSRSRWFLFIGSLSALVLMASCINPTLEGRGNEAYTKAQKATGNEKRRLEKLAYTYYWRAIKKQSDKGKINNRLRNRFIEMTLKRGNLILSEANANMDALELFVDDIDSVMSPEVDPQLRQQYASYLTRLADSTFARGKLDHTLEWLDQAIEIADNPSEIESRKEAIIDSFVNTKLQLARIELEEAKGGKNNSQELIEAEFHAKLARHFDPDNEEAQKILSKIYPRMKSIYSAYDIMDERPDSAVFDAVNKYDILLAVSNVSKSRRAVTLKVNMYNYSWNPLRLWARDFYIEDANGKRYRAYKSSRVEPEILDQEHETTKLRLKFPRPSSSIKKLIYEDEKKEHYSEKYLR